jgi:hypothetical protein
MQVQPLGLNRLFVTMLLVICTALIGMGCVEFFFVRPLRQSIEKGLVNQTPQAPQAWVAQTYAD